MDSNSIDFSGTAVPRMLTLQVEGMSCTGCEQRIGNALRRVEGVREASADHATGQVRVRVGPGVEPEALAERITAAGYTVTGTQAGADTGAGEDPE